MPDELTGLPLRAAVAVEVMGWTDVEIDTHDVCAGYAPEAVLRGLVPEWERDRTAAQQVIERIEEMGLRKQFLAHLMILFGTNTYPILYWGLLNITPEAICQSALSVVRAAEKGPRHAD